MFRLDAATDREQLIPVTKGCILPPSVVNTAGTLLGLARVQAHFRMQRSRRLAETCASPSPSAYQGACSSFRELFAAYWIRLKQAVHLQLPIETGLST
ncbi:MAG: hypothetical protein ACE5GZ_09055 [Gammaproteobacteria bacterium]